MTTSDHEAFAYRFARGVLRPPMMAVTRRDWRGQQNIPRTGGFVLAVNHISHFDPLVVAHFLNDTGRAPRFLAKEEMFGVPGVGGILRGAQQIPVHRLTRDAARAVQAAVDAVRAGQCVVIYPEGTLTRDPELWPMVGRTGAARVALTTGAPVVPCAQWGAQEVLAPYRKMPHLLRRAVMQVEAGPPVDLDDLQGQGLTSEVLREATERITTAIVRLLEGFRATAAPERRWDPREHDAPRTGNPNRGRRGRKRA